MNHPIHFDCYNIIDYLKDGSEWYFTIKMDGINLTYSKDKFKSDTIRHKTSNQYSNVLSYIHNIYTKYNYLEMEYFPNNNVAFIFDKLSINGSKREIVYEEINNLDNLIDDYTKILNVTDRSSILIINKPYFRITNKIECLKFLINKLNDTSDKLNQIADGFILTNFNDNINLKLKPLNQLTIDLKYNNGLLYDSDNNSYDLINNNLINNKIYQLNYDDENMWTINKIRNDKVKPNSKLIVQSVIDIIKYWPEFVNTIFNNNIIFDQFISNNYYDETTTNNSILSKNHNIVINNSLNIIRPLIDNNSNILDIGCGSGYIILNNLKFNKYLGIDIDYNKIKKSINRFNNGHFILADCNKIDNTYKFQPDYNFMIENYDNFDTLFMIYSAHYLQTKEFIDFVNKFKNIKKIIMMIISDNYIKSISTKNTQGLENEYTFIHPKNNKEWTEPLFDVNFWFSNLKITNIDYFDINQNIDTSNMISVEWYNNNKLILINLN